ncbi:MAG: hypothetical protein ACI9DF_001621 [Verrucomicrobiales bacterium]|jgi:hypothetical protein
MRILLFLLLTVMVAVADDSPKFRSDDNSDQSLPWFQLVDGEFPPENSAHYVSGELVGVDHLERTITLRVDRNDAQGRALMDYPLGAAMLPCGSVYYNNAPAALRDIPLGTHLHGWYYARPEKERFWELRNGKPHAMNGQRASLEVDFTRCFRLEDDFTFYSRKKQAWRIGKVDLTEKKLTATLEMDGKPVGEPKFFDLTSSTAVFLRKEFATLDDIVSEQEVQMNLTWATLYGPGRIFEIWLDEESRQRATARQLERHRNHIRERGLPGLVAAVDDKKRVVTITFFDSVDPSLFKDLSSTSPKPLGWPTSEYEEGNLSPKGNIVVARECLMTYDQVNDRKGGNILKIGNVPVRPGCSGVQIQVQCGILLEGFRPGKIVRFFPATWPVIALPKEEGFHGRE